MSIEQSTAAFVTQLKESYFIKRDADALLACMAPAVSWMGTGENELCHGRSEAEAALRKEMQECRGAFLIVYEDLCFQPLSPETCLAYGQLIAQPNDASFDQLRLHISLICGQTPQGMKLLHANFSRPDGEQEQGHFYVPSEARAKQEALQRILQKRERQLENLTHNIPGGAHQCANQPGLPLLAMSNSFLSMFGYTREDVYRQFGNKFLQMIYPEDRAGITEQLRLQLQQGPDIELEYRVMHKNGDLIWVLDKGRLLDAETEESYFFCLLHNITQRKQEQEELRLSLERHKLIMDQTTDIVFEWDLATDSLIFSPNWYKKFGYVPIQHRISRLLPRSGNIHQDDLPKFTRLMQKMSSGVDYAESEVRLRNAHCDFFWCRIRATAQFGRDGSPVKIVGVILDINTERKERDELLELAQKDALTSLYNKAAIKSRVEKELQLHQNGGAQVLFILDVDNFKTINDTYGHLCGDAILSDIATVLKNSFSSSGLLGRIGGDEFLIYLPQVESQQAAAQQAHALLEELGHLVPAAGAAPLSCSLGGVLCGNGEASYMSLYHQADQALYHQKSVGKNGVAFFEEALLCNDLSCELAHSAVGTDIVSDELSGVDEELAQYAFRMLYQSIDIHTAIHQILEIIGRAYDVSRVYIFESTEDGLYCNNTYEWCAPGVVPEIDKLQHLSYQNDLGDYLKNFGEDGVFYCRDIRTLHPSLYEVLAPQGIRALLQCAVLNAGRFTGYVGFDECRESRHWTRQQISTLTLTANVLAVFLTKLRLEQRLNHLLAQLPQS